MHVNLGHASAQQLKTVLVDSLVANTHLLNYVDEILGNCGVCRAFGKGPHVPIASTPAVSMINEKLQVGLFFLGDNSALYVMDASSE